MKKKIKKVGAFGFIAVAAFLVPCGAVAEGIMKSAEKACEDYKLLLSFAKEVWRE